MNTRIFTMALAFVMCLGLAVPAWASEEETMQECAINEVEEIVISNDFIKNAKYTLSIDSYGNPVITLNNTEKISDDKFASTAVLILPETFSDADEIITCIKTIKDDLIAIPYGSGTSTEDSWFAQSSVYLQSTIYYSNFTDEYKYGRIDKVDISVRTNSGTTISSLTLNMGQNGFTYGGGAAYFQTKEYDALTARTFTPPASWKDVLWENYQSQTVGAHLNGVATRPSGETFKLALYNNIFGDSGSGY